MSDGRITYRTKLRIVEMPRHHYGPRFHLIETRAVVGGLGVISQQVGPSVWTRPEIERMFKQAKENP